MGIFEQRVAFKPFEYPEIIKFKDAINHSYWLVSEWSFISDIQDFHVSLNDSEREAIKRAMLAIAQIEVSVKRFWARLGERIQKSEFDQIGVTFAESECFDKQTEILTEDGWKYFHELKNEKVAQYDITNGCINFVLPTNYISKQYNGLMHHYNSLGSDLMVTPNHEILTMHPQKSYYEKKKSSNGIWAKNYRYPLSGKIISSSKIKFNDLDRLLIAIQADGSLLGNCPTGTGRRDFIFGLSKPRKINRLVEICDNLGIELKISQNKKGQTVLFGKLPEEAPEVNTIKSFDYIKLNKINLEYCIKFLDELKHWDATIVSDSSFSYYNANLKAIDKVQAICTLCGFNANKGINRNKEEIIKLLTPDKKTRKSAKTIYVLSITQNDKKIYPKRQEIKYNDMVYCVEVPLGCIVTRRNSRVAISGNCRHSDAYSHLLEVLGLNDEFTNLMTVPEIQGRVDYLTKYLKGAADNSHENYTLSLALFSLFIENVSLFSQFLIIKSFSKYRNQLKDIDNVIQATAQEERLHAMFGSYLVTLIKKEYPDWFNEDFYNKVERAAKKALDAELKIIDWIFENGELDFLPKEVVVEYIKHRFNTSLEMIGGKAIFEVNTDKVMLTQWFDDELESETNFDFFYKKPVTYCKFDQAITENDLF